MSVNSKMTAIADPIRTLMGSEGKLGLDAMAENLDEAVAKVDTQADLIQQIKTALADKAAGGVELPPLDDAVRATASDMASGKQLYDDDGNVVEGEVEEITHLWDAWNLISQGEPYEYLSDDTDRYSLEVDITPKKDVLFRQSAHMTVEVNSSYLGDAKPEDVRAGVYFTSGDAGLCKVGTALLPGGGSVYPEGAFAPVTNFTDGKQYALVATINGVRRYLNNTTFNDWTMNATQINIAEDAGDYVLFSATPVLFTAVASGDGFLLQNGSNYLSGNSNNGSALRVDSTQAVWTVNTSESAGLEEGKYLPKEDPNAVWLFHNYNGYDWTIKFEENNNSFGFDRNGRDSDNSKGYVSFVLYEYVAGEGELNPIVDSSDANVTADKMLAGYSGYANGRKVNGNIELQSKTVTENGTVTPDVGKLLSSVVVNVTTGGGSVIKTGTTTSATIATGLSSIEEFFIYKESQSATGLIHLHYSKTDGTSYLYCSAWSTSNYGTKTIKNDTTAATVSGGSITLPSSTATSGGLSSGVTYTWVAIGTE